MILILELLAKNQTKHKKLQALSLAQHWAGAGLQSSRWSTDQSRAGWRPRWCPLTEFKLERKRKRNRSP